MRKAAQGGAVTRELASAVVDEVESKKHRRDPFGDRYVALATSTFGGDAQDGGRAAVEAVTTHVHVRVELIRSMKNALVKQMQEAEKRSAQLGPPPARQRLGTRARLAAAAAASAAPAAEDHLAGEADTPDAAFFCDTLHQELEQLLSGSGLGPDAATSLAAAQEALCAGRDGTVLPPANLALPVESELAPPPFDAFVQQLFGCDASDSMQTATAAAAALPPDEAAGLAAAVHALQLHTAGLERRGVLHVPGTAADHWLPSDGCAAARGGAGCSAAGLPPYLQAAQPARGGQACLEEPVWPLQPGADSRCHHWPAAEEGAAAGEGHDAIQEVEAAPDWGALEGDAPWHPRRPALQLNLQAQAQGGPAAGGVLVAFDDTQQAQQAQPWQAGQAAWHSRQQQGQQLGQATLSDIWEGGDGGVGPWEDTEEEAGGTPQWWQQAPLLAPQLPTWAPPPGQQQPAPSPVQLPQRAACADDGIEDEEWDELMLEQVAALEQHALLERRHAPGGGQPSQAQQGKRRVPVFRSRAIHGQMLPAESIEEADSEEEEAPPAAAAAGPQQPVAAAAERAAAGAVPQLGERGALQLASQATAAGQALCSDGEGEGAAPLAAAGAQHQQRGQQDSAAASAAGGGGLPAVQVDFSAIDVESLRPSVLLRPLTGGRPKWRPVFDPEHLLLQPLRSALRPLPRAQRGATGGHCQVGSGAQAGPPASCAPSDLLAGITAADLEGWDDWGDEEAAAADWGAEEAAAADCARVDGGGWDEAAGRWDAASGTQQRQQQQQQQQQQHQYQQQQQQQQQVVVFGWDEPGTAGGQILGGAPAPPAAEPAPRAAPSVHIQPLVELAFDCDDGGSQASEQQEQSQVVQGATQPPSQQQAAWVLQGSPSPASMSVWQSQREAGPSVWQQGLEWQPASQQCEGLGQAPAAGGDVWAGLGQAADEQGSWSRECAQPAVRPEVGRSRRGGGQAAGASSPATADAPDPWEALGGDEAPAAPGGSAGGGSWFSQQAAEAAVWPADAAAGAVANPREDACGGSSPCGGWGLDVDWQDAGPDTGEQGPQSSRRQRQQELAHAETSTAAAEQAFEEAAAEAAADASKGRALEWEFDEPEQAAEPAAAGSAGSLAARLAALGVLDHAVPAVVAAAAGKRRHEQIAAEIIQGLLEERRRARVDLQPLLQQLSSQLAAALAGTNGGGAGSSSSSSSSVGGKPATLSAVRQACLSSGAPGVQATMQRYLVALLTAAHQNNSNAAAAGEVQGGGAVAPAAAVAPLAAALAGKQLLLCAPGGATDVQVAVV